MKERGESLEEISKPFLAALEIIRVKPGSYTSLAN
jgi:hypothetical protein